MIAIGWMEFGSAGGGETGRPNLTNKTTETVKNAIATSSHHALRITNHIALGLPDQISSSSGSSSDFSLIVRRRFAPVLGALLLDEGEVLVEHDAAFACERDKALAARAADQCEIGLAGKLHAPGGEARARDQDRDAHAHGLDHHLGREPPGGVEELVVGAHAMLEHPARDLIDRVMAADVLHVDQRPILLRQHAAVDGAGFEIERGRSVDLMAERIEP